MPITEAFEKLRAEDADIVGANCLNGPQAMLRLFERMPAEGLLSAFPNAGYPKYHDGRYFITLRPIISRISEGTGGGRGAAIGGCCGIGPQHIAAMVQALKGLEPVTTKVFVRGTCRAIAAARGTGARGGGSEHPRPDRGRENRHRDGTRPAENARTGKIFRRRKGARDAGSDVITLADNSLAILRVSNLAIGAMLKERYGIDSLLHLSCRDRNLIGLQSELMGMAALGIRHVLPLTGDPAKLGDHPGASSVYDVSSMELIRIIRAAE